MIASAESERARSKKGDFLFIKNYFLEILKLFRPYVWGGSWARRRLLGCLLLAALEVAVTVSLPYFIKKIMEYVSGDISFDLGDGFVIIFGSFAVLTLLDKINHYFQDILFFPVINEAIRDLTDKTVAHVHKLPWQETQQLSLGKVLSSLKRISLSARFFIRSCFLTGITTFLKLIFSLVILFRLEVLTAEMSLCFAACLITFFLTMRWYLKVRVQSWEKTDRATDAVKDSLLQTKFVRYFKDVERERIRQVLKQEAQGWIQTNLRLNLMHIGTSGCLAVISIMVIYWGIQGVKAGSLTLGDFVLLKSQLGAAFVPLRSWFLESRQALEATVDIQQVFHILQKPLPLEILSQKTFISKEDTKKHPAFVLSHVSFRYGKDQGPFIEDLSFSFPWGQKGALIGPTGGGKSTVLHLLRGLLRPTEGSVQLLGHDLQNLQDLPPSFLHFIPQESYLFQQTLRYNITYGCPSSLKEEEIWEALSHVSLDHWVRALPQGLETWVGDMGARLSGGERQRIALARALLLKPKILLLDETTNALDEEVEKKIMGILKRKIPTLILATHQTSFLSSLDWVGEVSQGKIKKIKGFLLRRSRL